MTWAFEFEDQPYFAGFRVLATNGIELPVLNVFRMFGLMGGSRLVVESTADAGVEAIRTRGVRGDPDVSALASLRDGTLCVLIWHYHDDDLPGPTAAVTLELDGLAVAEGPVLLHHYRIDRDHSNAFEAWKRMGAPQPPSPEQYAALKRAAQLTLLTSPEWIRVQGGRATLRLELPRQAVSLLTLRRNVGAHQP